MRFGSAAVLVLASLGCGRVGFDRLSDGPDVGPDATVMDASDGSITDAADADSAMPTIKLVAIETPTIDPLMLPSFAVQDLAAHGDGFCSCGAFAADIVIGGVTRTSVGDDDAWMGCFDADLNLRWLQTAGTAGSDITGALAVYPSGDVVFRGLIQGSADFGGGIERFFGADDWFVARYDRGGGFVNAEVFGSSGDDDYGNGVLVRADGSIVVTGGCFAGIDFGGGALSGSADREGCFALLDDAWSQLASFAWGGAGAQFLSGAAELSADRFVVTENFETGLDLGSGVIPSAGGQDVAIFVVTSAGVIESQWTISGPLEQYAREPLVAGDGNVYVVGSTRGDTDFGDGVRTLAGTAGFVASYDAAGALRWARFIGDGVDGPSFGDDLAIDGDGSIYAVGGIDSGAVFDGSPVGGAGGLDAYIVALDPSGHTLWKRVFGSSGDDRLKAVTVLAGGAIVVGGYADGSFVVDGLTVDLTSRGTFLAKLALE